MLLIMISDQYPNYYKVIEVDAGYFDSLDILTFFLLSQQYRYNERLLYMKFCLGDPGVYKPSVQTDQPLRFLIAFLIDCS